MHLVFLEDLNILRFIIFPSELFLDCSDILMKKYCRQHCCRVCSHWRCTLDKFL